MTLCQGHRECPAATEKLALPLPLGMNMTLYAHKPHCTVAIAVGSGNFGAMSNISSTPTSGVDGLHVRENMTAAVLYENDDEMVIITLNRPEALDSINRQLRQELNEAIVRFDRDDQARVAIITGAGRAFCAGRDLKERAADNAAGMQARANDSMGADNLAWFEQTWKP